LLGPPGASAHLIELAAIRRIREPVAAVRDGGTTSFGELRVLSVEGVGDPP
jgi:hypothetical protein